MKVMKFVYDAKDGKRVYNIEDEKEGIWYIYTKKVNSKGKVLVGKKTLAKKGVLEIPIDAIKEEIENFHYNTLGQ